MTYRQSNSRPALRPSMKADAPSAGGARSLAVDCDRPSGAAITAEITCAANRAASSAPLAATTRNRSSASAQPLPFAAKHCSQTPASGACCWAQHKRGRAALVVASFPDQACKGGASHRARSVRAWIRDALFAGAGLARSRARSTPTYAAAVRTAPPWRPLWAPWRNLCSPDVANAIAPREAARR
jgi:hypothetical protein